MDNSEGDNCDNRNNDNFVDSDTSDGESVVTDDEILDEASIGKVFPMPERLVSRFSVRADCPECGTDIVVVDNTPWFELKNFARGQHYFDKHPSVGLENCPEYKKF